MAKVILTFLSFATVSRSMIHSSYCSIAFPVKGTWLADKPYWNIKGCPSKSFDMKSTVESLAGRTVYVLGDSIARQVIISLSTLMGDQYVNRSNQKSLCPRDVMWYGGACSLEVKNTLLKFKYLDCMDGFDYSSRGGFPFLFKKTDIVTFKDINEAAASINEAAPLAFRARQKDAAAIFENVREDVRSSLLSFFNGSTSNDNLIFNLGMKYAAKCKIIDYPAWLASSAKAFRDHITVAFKGRYFVSH
jgi:hypothetical protein